MKRLSIFVTLVALAALGATWLAFESDMWAPTLGVVGVICAWTTYRSARISTYLQLLIKIFSWETILFGTITVLRKFHLLPQQGFFPTDILAVGAAIFSILIYWVSFVPIVRTAMRIADLFFDYAEDRIIFRPWLMPAMWVTESVLARAGIIFLMLVNQAQVAISVRINFFNRAWFDAMQEKNETEFWHQVLKVFLPLIVAYVVAIVAEYIVREKIILRWRRFLTARYISDWLEASAHYRMTLIPDSSDNPDQRIADDIFRFVDGGDVRWNGIYSFSIRLIATLTTVIWFSVVLWNLSPSFPIPGTTFVLPGFLCWVTIIYAIIGTVITHFIGHPLIKLYFQRQQTEADFRFALARNREYAEQIALLGGEPQEHRFLMNHFGFIFTNYLGIISQYKWLLIMQNFYDRISWTIPFVLCAPYYFLDKMTFGVLTQTSSAFSSVEYGMSFFIAHYNEIAEYRSVLDRLTSFEESIGRAHGLGSSEVLPAPDGTNAIEVNDLNLRLPDGRLVVRDARFVLVHGESVLVTGPSGSGKSTLFRAMAGVWPFKTGNIRIAPNDTLMLLPQQPYFPIDTLRSAMTYPHPPETFEDMWVRKALIAVTLGELEPDLDVEDNWSHRLSGGQKQRISLARALLAQPDWLLLDESTSALEEDMEALLYNTLAAQLPKTTLISIGHRNTLRAFHTRTLVMEFIEPGVHRPVLSHSVDTAGSTTSGGIRNTAGTMSSAENMNSEGSLNSADCITTAGSIDSAAESMSSSEARDLLVPPNSARSLNMARSLNLDGSENAMVLLSPEGSINSRECITTAESMTSEVCITTAESMNSGNSMESTDSIHTID